MSRSRPRSKPFNYLSRRQQSHLLLMVMLLGLVVILINEAGNPRNYTWLWRAAQEDGGPAPVAGHPADGPPVDDHVRPKPPLKDVPGTFYWPAPVERQAEGDSSGEYFRGVKPELLGAIRDDTTFRNDERHAWFNLLGVLQKTDEHTLEKASLGRVAYLQLFEQSYEYRGKLVTIRGRVHRAMPAGAPKNDIGIEQYYQLCVQPDDAPDYLIVAYCLELPEGFPTGMEILEQAQITGFSFKRWPYLAPGALRTAPTLAAKTVRWIQTPPQKESPGPDLVVLAVVAAAAFTAIALVYVYLRTRRGTTRQRETAPRLEALRDADLGSNVGQAPGEPADKRD